MLVSVITVCLNRAGTIGRALESVAGQDHRDIEHIVVDGGSTDGTQDVVKKFGSRIARLVSEPDAGIYDAMNKGLRLASGEVVAFLHSDDAFADERVVADMAGALCESGCDAVFGDLEYVDRSGNRVRIWNSSEPEPFSSGWVAPSPTFFISKAAYDRVGEYSREYPYAADIDFQIRLLSEPGMKVRYLPRLAVRMATGGLSTRYWRGALAKDRELRAILRKHGLPPIAITKMFLRKIPQFAALLSLSRSRRDSAL